jgi:phage terminase Nu1 subunit (DNA packaging protein)
MARAITVKVATPKVIKALENKLAEIKSNKENEKANEANYREQLEAWRVEVAKFAVANISKATDVGASQRYNAELSVSFNLPAGTDGLPKEPQRKYETIQDWKFNEIVEEISNALSILRMTDEETVNASTMKSIAKYL